MSARSEFERAERMLQRALKAEARLAAVEALCDEMSGGDHWQTYGVPVVAVEKVRAAARGEGDRV